MKLIIGLGNPGKSYAKTRHNIGFRVLDEIFDQQKIKTETDRKLFSEASFHAGAEKVILARPKTYMNESGEALKALLAHRPELKPRDCLVVVDDVNLPVGKIRLRGDGSAGGHNGLKSLIHVLGSKDFPRLRVGVGRAGVSGDLTEFVLGKFDLDEEKVLKMIIPLVSEACLTWATLGVQTAMNRFNKI